MSDPIEKLNRLGDALEGAPMPLPASEIRARGDRIRRRKHAVIAGAGAAVIAAVAVPVVALTVTGSDDKPAPTPSPTITDPVPAAPLSAENLLTSEDAIYPNGGGDWQEADTYPGDGQAAVSLCQQSSFDGLGADTVWVRTFEFYSADIGAVDLSNLFSEVVAEFPSAAGAETAYETVQGWYDDCRPDGGTGFAAGEVTEVPIGVDGTAERQLLISSSPDDGNFLDVGFVLSGDRIALLTQETPGQDYNWPEGGSPVEQMLPVAAERLVLGTAPDPDQTPTDVETDWPTTIPAGFPLDSGWPRDGGEYQLEEPSSVNQAMFEAGELRACGNDAVDPGAADRLTTRIASPADFFARELQLFPTDQEAVTWVAHLRALYQGCPTEGATPVMTTEVSSGSVGDESVLITRVGEEIWRTVINVVRIGNAVVVDQASDEGLAADVVDLATVTREDLADVIAEMTELQGGDPSATPDLDDPALVPTVPEDFPLGLALSEPPVEDDETTIEGPAPGAAGARALTMCGNDLSLPDSGDGERGQTLSYSVSTIGGYDGRTVHAFDTVGDAIDRMDQIRAVVQGCDRDNGGDGISDRLFRTFSSNTGYDSLTFDWYYEATENQPAVAGQLYTVLRVGNAILTLEWGSEGSAESQADAAPAQVEFAKVLAGEMCVFQEAGC